MFSFLDMLSTHQDRLVDRYEQDDVIVDTCSVGDSAQPYETGVSHPDYNDGKYVIVEMYDTPEQAQEGHNKWVQAMTTEPLPDSLVDISSAMVAELRNVVCGKEGNVFLRKQKKEKQNAKS